MWYKKVVDETTRWLIETGNKEYLKSTFISNLKKYLHINSYVPYGHLKIIKARNIVIEGNYKIDKFDFYNPDNHSLVNLLEHCKKYINSEEYKNKNFITEKPLILLNNNIVNFKF